MLRRRCHKHLLSTTTKTTTLGACSSFFLTSQFRFNRFNPQASTGGGASKAAEDKTKAMQVKIATGTGAAFIAATSTILACHLVVTPVPLSIGLGTIVSAAATGALAGFEGGKESETGTSFGAVGGLLIGAMGAYYCQSTNEPWKA